jgi:hypothetical protein
MRREEAPLLGSPESAHPVSQRYLATEFPCGCYHTPRFFFGVANFFLRRSRPVFLPGEDSFFTRLCRAAEPGGFLAILGHLADDLVDQADDN